MDAPLKRETQNLLHVRIFLCVFLFHKRLFFTKIGSGIFDKKVQSVEQAIMIDNTLPHPLYSRSTRPYSWKTNTSLIRGHIARSAADKIKTFSALFSGERENQWHFIIVCISGFILCTPFFVENGKCLHFLELTPTLWLLPLDVTNISEDWADFCQCQEFWLISWASFSEKMNVLNDTKISELSKSAKEMGNICYRLWRICWSVYKKPLLYLMPLLA